MGDVDELHAVDVGAGLQAARTEQELREKKKIPKTSANSFEYQVGCDVGKFPVPPHVDFGGRGRRDVKPRTHALTNRRSGKSRVSPRRDTSSRVCCTRRIRQGKNWKSASSETRRACNWPLSVMVCCPCPLSGHR